ncbi:MAG TPA: YgiQ family radical SAM protein [Candidatus Gallibacteroides avistercoris]|uniref:YgiQ family radical SAM protein n=1 Tax=Candidatus Gallibacteroides avistercoris TaxID=2840833 RepID=A0A9D1M982_9BACT|nr:YgiQ family radical SAM protein [Candidatus Gallibacteroides avistercoris]
MGKYTLSDWLPTTKKEVELRGWDYIDVILFSGDAYVDHPSFGMAVLGRTLEAHGWRVAIVPQPNWRDDLRDFKKLGKPRLFFGVSAGAMDSMVNRYTANKRLRSDDAYTPDGRADMRPDYTTIVYSRILKELFPDVPVVIGGIEASMRRLAHYDYWEDRLRPSILFDAPADLLIYGMGERPITELAKRLAAGEKVSDIQDLPQSACITTRKVPANDPENLVLISYEECLKSKKWQSENTQHVDQESHRYAPRTIWQTAMGKTVVVNPPYPPMTEAEIDASFDLPYTRMPHPKYKGKTIPAYEMIKFSVNTHRGCFGGCSFCAISAHQGKFVSSRSKASILKEVKAITQMPGFAGYLSDLGGPSANMYKMGGRNKEACQKCGRPSCLYPEVCKNLNTDHSSLLDLYRSVDKIKGIKKSFIGSGVRYDMLIHRSNDEKINAINREYTEELIARHVSGRLKVAPEHTSDKVLDIMRKPSFKLFEEFKRTFEKINALYGLNQQIIPYFISSHPGCTEEDMAELAVITKRLHFQLEQIQDFTPTPMTLSTEMYYTGYNPYTKKPVYTARTREEKLAQRQFFFWYKPEQRKAIENSLRRINRLDLFQQLYNRPASPQKRTNKPHKK